MKYFRTFAGLMAVVIMTLTVVSVADATTKSRALLQTDLDNDKLDTFSPHLMHENMTNMTDSHFNTTTDDINDIGSITATETEINNVADDSARVSTISGTVTLTPAAHGTGAINYVSSTSANAVVTIPEATGTGTCYELVWQGAPTAGGDTIQVTGDDEFQGILRTLTDDAANMEGWAAAIGSDNDSINLSSSTQLAAGGLLQLQICDVDTDTLSIRGSGNSTGTEATPFATGQRP